MICSCGQRIGRPQSKIRRTRRCSRRRGQVGFPRFIAHSAPAAAELRPLGGTGSHIPGTGQKLTAMIVVSNTRAYLAYSEDREPGLGHQFGHPHWVRGPPDTPTTMRASWKTRRIMMTAWFDTSFADVKACRTSREAPFAGFEAWIGLRRGLSGRYGGLSGGYGGLSGGYGGLSGGSRKSISRGPRVQTGRTSLSTRRTRSRSGERGSVFGRSWLRKWRSRAPERPSKGPERPDRRSDRADGCSGTPMRLSGYAGRSGSASWVIRTAGARPAGPTAPGTAPRVTASRKTSTYPRRPLGQTRPRRRRTHPRRRNNDVGAAPRGRPFRGPPRPSVPQPPVAATDSGQPQGVAHYGTP
jgi:hypothetical protein